MSVKALLYDADGLDREIAFDEKLIAERSAQCLLWIDVTGRERQKIEQVASLLKFHPASVKAVANDLGNPRLYNYGHYFQFGVTALNPKENRYTPAPVEFFCGAGYVVTIHDEEIGFLREFKEQDRGETRIGSLDSSVVVASMLDWHLGTYFRALRAFELEIDRIDEEVLTRPVARQRLTELTALRRLISQLRGLLIPQEEVFYGLTRPDFTLAEEKDATVHFQALERRYERAVDLIENARNLMLGSFDLFTSRAAESTNSSVKALTLLTILLGVTGTVAGIFGMNFEVEYWKTGSLGFWAVVGGMALLIAGAVIFARIKKWI